MRPRARNRKYGAAGVVQKDGDASTNASDKIIVVRPLLIAVTEVS
jgi:hypothetical protein